jgi:hypothetical protein
MPGAWRAATTYPGALPSEEGEVLTNLPNKGALQVRGALQVLGFGVAGRAQGLGPGLVGFRLHWFCGVEAALVLWHANGGG